MTADVAFADLVRAIVREVLAEERAQQTSAEYLSTTSAARLADVAVGTIRRWVAEGRLTPHRAGRHVRVRRDELEALLAAGRVARSSTTRDPAPEKLTPEEIGRRLVGGR